MSSAHAPKILKAFSVADIAIGDVGQPPPPPPPPPPGTPYYGAAAPWNVPVAGLTLDPASSTLVSRLWAAEGAIMNATFVQYTIAIYETDGRGGKPAASMNVQVSYTDHGHADWSDIPEGGTVPFDPSWFPSSPAGTPRWWPNDASEDSWLVIINPATGENWYCWQANYMGGKLQCGSVCKSEIDYRTGTAIPAGDSDITGSGVPHLVGIVRPEEVALGVVAHALRMPALANAAPGASEPFRAWAQKTDGHTTPGVPCGTRFAITHTDAELHTWANAIAGASAAGKASAFIIGVALRDYGWFVGDTAGHNHLQFEDQLTADWTPLGLGVGMVGMFAGLFSAGKTVAFAPPPYLTPPPPPPWPYPDSTTWRRIALSGNALTKGPGADQWYLTAKPSSNLLGVWGDGNGWLGSAARATLGVTEIAGLPSGTLTGTDRYLGPGTTPNRKPNAVVHIGGSTVLMWYVNDTLDSRHGTYPAISTDDGVTWTFHESTGDRIFSTADTPPLQVVGALQLGNGYGATPPGIDKNYVYLYLNNSGNLSNPFTGTNGTIWMARVKIAGTGGSTANIIGPSKYSFLAGFDISGNPIWTADGAPLDASAYVFQDPDGMGKHFRVDWSEVNSRYFVAFTPTASSVALYETLSPFGSWKTLYYGPGSDPDWTAIFSAQVPGPWTTTSALWLAVSGNPPDSLEIQIAPLILINQPPPPTKWWSIPGGPRSGRQWLRGVSITGWNTTTGAEYENKVSPIDVIVAGTSRASSVGLPTWAAMAGGPLSLGDLTAYDNFSNIVANSQCDISNTNFGAMIGLVKPHRGWLVHVTNTNPDTPSTATDLTVWHTLSVSGTHDDYWYAFGRRMRTMMEHNGFDPWQLMLRPNHEMNQSNTYQVFASNVADYAAAMARFIRAYRAGYNAKGTVLKDGIPFRMPVIFSPARHLSIGTLQSFFSFDTDGSPLYDLIDVSAHPAGSMNSKQTQLFPIQVQAMADWLAGGYDSNTPLYAPNHTDLTRSQIAFARSLGLGVCYTEWSARYETALACEVHAAVNRGMHDWLTSIKDELAFDTVFHHNVLVKRAQDASLPLNWDAGVDEYITDWSGDLLTGPPPPPPPPTVTVTQGPIDILPDAATVGIEPLVATRSGDLSAASSVPWTVQSGAAPAVDGTDFGLPAATFPNGTFQFPIAAQTATDSFNIAAKAPPAADENAKMVLGPPVNATLAGAQTFPFKLLASIPIVINPITQIFVDATKVFWNYVEPVNFKGYEVRRTTAASVGWAQATVLFANITVKQVLKTAIPAGTVDVLVKPTLQSGQQPSVSARVSLAPITNPGYPSGLLWLSGLNPEGDTGTSGMAMSTAFGNWRGRNVDIWNVKGNRLATWSGLVNSIKKPTPYQTAYARNIRIQQVIPLIAGSNGGDDLNACGSTDVNSASVKLFLSSHKQMAAWCAAQNLKRPFIIRLGHELEDSGNAYSPALDSDQTNFSHYKLCFQRAADIWHAALGGPPDFYIDQCHLRTGALTQRPWDDYFPGTQYVDVAGIDPYCTVNDAYIKPNTCKINSAADMARYLDGLSSPGHPDGPRAAADWAIARGLKTGLGEWAITSPKGLPGFTDGAPGNPNDVAGAYYLQGMYDFFSAYHDTVLYECYFDVNASPKDHRVVSYDGKTCSALGVAPAASAAYLNRWTP